MSAVLRVVRGNPTPEELAAVVVLLAARSAAGTPVEDVEERSLWARPQLRRPLHPGPGSWQASNLPSNLPS